MFLHKTLIYAFVGFSLISKSYAQDPTMDPNNKMSLEQYYANGLWSQMNNNDFQSPFNKQYWKNKKPYEGYWQQDVYYRIQATLDEDAETITGGEKLYYTNNSPNTITEAYFHLYQNSFQPSSLTNELYQINKTKVNYGRYESQNLGIRITSFKIDNVSIPFTVDRTILKVVLPQPLKSGETIAFNIDFVTFFDRGSIRRRMKVYNHHGVKHFNGVHWYPRICVYDRKFTWETAQHLEKEFYGDYGAFDVELKLPEHYIVDATGKLVNEEFALPDELINKLKIENFANKPIGSEPSIIIPPSKKLKSWFFHANNVHDFAWTADPTYRFGKVEWNGISCVALAQENNAAGWQKTAQFLSEIIKLYSKDFGLYEYPKIIAADAEDGMEYPMLTLDGGYFPSHMSLLAHEVGHNWFFGMIGSNETYRASLDEGFTQFLTAWAMRRLSKEPMPEYQRVFAGYIEDAIDGNDVPLNTHSNEFNSAIGHGGGYKHVYFKTATMLYNLQYFLGDSVFLAAMKNYVKQWKFCHPYVEDFRNSIIQSAQTDLNKFFDQWFETKDACDYSIQNVKRIKPGTFKLTFKRYQNLIMPLNIDVYYSFTDPKTGQEIIDVSQLTIPVTYYNNPERQNTLPWIGWDKLSQTFSVELNYPMLDAKILQVWIDPSGRLADINRVNNVWKHKIKWSIDLGNGQDKSYLSPYNLEFRPAATLNFINGLSFGGRIKGQYAGRKHQLNIRFLYNTGIYSTVSENALFRETFNPFTYNATWSHQVRKGGEYFAGSQLYNNQLINKLGWKFSINQHSFGIEGKSINAYKKLNQIYYFAPPNYYSIYEKYNYNGGPNMFANQSAWSHQRNISLNLFYKFNYTGWGKSGSFEIKTRLSSPWSQIQYGFIQSTWKHNQPIGKLNLLSRVFAQLGTGSQPAAESALYAAGANPEDAIDNEIIRDFGGFNYMPIRFEKTMPVTQLNTAQYLNYGGGLNLRGYSNLAIAQKIGDTIYAFYRGNSGVSVNLEIDFTRALFPNQRNKFIQLQPYLFFDGGIISQKFNGSNIYSKPIADAGLGTMINLKPSGKTLFGKKSKLSRQLLTDVKPLQLRFELPLFLSLIPPTDPTHLMFRFRFGIERAF